MVICAVVFLLDARIDNWQANYKFLPHFPAFLSETATFGIANILQLLFAIAAEPSHVASKMVDGASGRSIRIAGVLCLTERGVAPAGTKFGFDLSLILKLRLFGMFPAVVSVVFEPALPLGPVKFPTSHSFLFDRLRKPVIVFWLVRHLQFGRITTQAKTSPLRSGTGESPERNDFEWLATCTTCSSFCPTDKARRT